MAKKKLYPSNIFLLRHIEKDGDEWYEAKENIADLDLPQGCRVDIARYDIASVENAGFMLEVK